MVGGNRERRVGGRRGDYTQINVSVIAESDLISLIFPFIPLRILLDSHVSLRAQNIQLPLYLTRTRAG
jgi:hypothetical protein